eukprot:TRINITY_DN1873_c0_g1_i1.p1 TRINITY_DN1873_c0_g1~~TRINITY_DN1873_c0_g1_i1.p1  ORF type:complete len:293 (-),score=55.81 TRINITY_DN1873_c0_g1_i1:29-907(-)
MSTKVENNKTTITNKPKSNLLILKREMLQLISGASSGAISKTISAPLERIKILYQVQGMKGSNHYKGTVNAFSTIVREEGLLGLWKGNNATVLKIIPTYALKFSLNDFIRDIVKKEGQKTNELTFNQMMIAGTLGGTIQIIMTYPLDIIRTRLSLNENLSSNQRYRGVFDCFRKIVSREGFFALYKGLGPTLFVGAPYVGLQMTFYDIYKRVNYQFFQKFDFQFTNNKVFEISMSLLAGAMAGLTAQTVTYPGDTLRKRLQSNGIGGETRKYENSFDAIKKNLQERRFQNFF